LTQTLEIAPHANECITGGEKERGESEESDYQGKAKVHKAKLNLTFPADKSLLLGTFQRLFT